MKDFSKKNKSLNKVLDKTLNDNIGDLIYNRKT